MAAVALTHQVHQVVKAALQLAVTALLLRLQRLEAVVAADHIRRTMVVQAELVAITPHPAPLDRMDMGTSAPALAGQAELAARQLSAIQILHG